VPSPLRDEYDPSKLYDTSNHNHSFANKMGIRPDGTKAHNGMDFWWDDEGVGNCWENNTSSRGEPTNNFTVDPGPCADGGSKFQPGLTVKDAGFLSCSQYDRNDPTWQHPPACEWFDSPQKPSDDQSGSPVGLPAPATSTSGISGPAASGLVGSLAGVAFVLLVGLGAVRRRRLTSSGS
jgi:hypothetical protein